MSRIVIDSTENITLVGGSAVAPGLIGRLLDRAPVLVAADGGADLAWAEGHRPRAVIGDMDSIADLAEWAARGVEMVEIAEQLSTDFEKCLYSLRAPLILACGFLGARTDHALAAMSGLLRYAEARVILVSETEIVFHTPPALAIDLPEGTTVSFFPLAPVTGTRSAGLEWSVEGLALRPGGRIGTSNRALGGRVEAGFDVPGVLTILPAAMLDAAMTALSTPAR